MAKLKFHWLSGQNFNSIGNTEVRFDFDKDKLTLIRGSNGDGKSTATDMVPYALFNKTPRNVKLGQLVNSVNKKKLLVKINFSINGVNYEVHRGQKPNVLDIYQDGDKLDNLSTAKEMQDYLENEILRCDFKTFMQTIMISSTGYTHFMELSTPDRRIMVEKMLDIEVVGMMSDVLKQKIKEASQNKNKVEIDYNSIDQSKKNIERLIASVSSVSDEQIKSIDGNIESLNKEINDLKVVYDEFIENEPNIDQDAERIAYNDANNKISAINGAIQLASQNQRQNESLINFYKNNDGCDRCGQEIDQGFKDNIIHKANNEIQDALDTISRHQNELPELKSIIDGVNAKVNELTQFNSEKQSILNKGKGLQNQVNSLMSQKQTLLNKGQQDTAGYYNELAELDDKLTNLIKVRAEVTETNESLRLCTDMLKDKGLKARIIRQYLPLMNKTINEYLDIMGAHYSFTLDENFNEKILSRYRDSFSYGSFSNGERMRINMAILFMWRKLATEKNTISSNLLFLDEVLDGSLDAAGIDSIFEILKSMDNSNLVVISHRKEITDRFDKVIEAKKVGNFSTYTEIL